MIGDEVVQGSNVVCIIQARMGSTRLPGKILMEVRPGVPMLAEVISRVRQMRAVNRVVVAFPRPDAEHEPARDVALLAGAEVFAPPPEVSENDVLTRYVLAARKYNADVVVRATCDCALFDPVLGDVVATTGGWGVSDYVRGRRAIEAFPVDVLMRAHRRAATAYDREHVTPWMYSPEAANNTAYVDDERPNWSVNTAADLARVREVLAKDPEATWRWNDGAMT